MPRHLRSFRFRRPTHSALAGLLVAGLVATAGLATATRSAAAASATSAAAASATSTVVVGAPVAFGTAPTLGSMAGQTLASPVVAMAPTPDGNGYWLVAADGGVFTFGDAHFFGSLGGTHLNQPIVGIAPTRDGNGYWLVAADGGIFSFGDAHFFGSTGGIHLNKPVVGMARTSDGNGYWLVASDGGIFTFGDAPFLGSTGGVHLDAPVVGMAASGVGPGYWLTAADGGVFTFGKAPFLGSLSGSLFSATGATVGGIAAAPDGTGYWLLPTAHPMVSLPSLPVLEPGDTGAAVLVLQQRLSALGYWVGTPDGSFGDSTEQAVWALQKAAGLSPDGVVGPATSAALDAGVLPHPRSTSGYVIEVDLTDDLLMFVTNGKIDYVFNTSTGGGYTYTDEGVTSVAETPVGQFQIYRQVDGLVTDSLGQLWMPKFFYEGFAIHGDGEVPPFPVSHGCVRVSDEAIDFIWQANLAPIGTEVWVYN